MHIRNKTASVLWKLALVAIATYGLLDGAGILAGTYHTGFPHMFTNVSNIFAWGYFPRIPSRRSRTAIPRSS